MEIRGQSAFFPPFNAHELLRGVLCLLFLSFNAAAAPLGMATDTLSNRMSLFDADLDSITASLDAGPAQALGDCVIARDEQLGIFSGSSAEITFIELAASMDQPPRAETRVGVSNLGVDMALSPDDAYVVLAGGGALQQPLSVVDTATRGEVSTAAFFADHTSVEFCDNGTLLVTTINGRAFDDRIDNAMYDARLGQGAEITLRGHRLSSGAQPNNSACAPGSLSGVLLDREGVVTSFTLPELELADRFDTGDGAALAAVFSQDGRELYVRTINSVQAFQFDPVTGALEFTWARSAPASPTYFGMEQIALHPDGGKLYVDGGESISVLDVHTGKQSAVKGPAGRTTGICFANSARPIAPGTLAQFEAP